MPSIFELYIKTATDYIDRWSKKPKKISRSKIELTILRELDKASFPIEWKMAWYQAVLTSDSFDYMWIGAKQKYSLSKAAITRYVPDQKLCTYSIDDCKEPIDDHSSGITSSYLGSTPIRATTSTSQDSSESVDDDWSDDCVEEVWYGEEGQAEKAKQMEDGDGKDINEVKAKKSATKPNAKPRIKKVINGKVTKKGKDQGRVHFQVS